MELVWIFELCRTCVNVVWNMCGCCVEVCECCVEHVWMLCQLRECNMCERGVIVEKVWMSCECCVEHVWSSCRSCVRDV